MKKNLGFILRLLVLIVSIYLMISIVDFKLVINYIVKIPIYLVVLLILIGIFRTWLTSLRWQLMNPDLTKQLKKWHYFRFMMLSHAFNLFLPGALGGDFARAAATINTVKSHKIDNMIAIVVDRFVGFLSITILSTLAFILTKNLQDRSTFHLLFAFLYLTIAAVIILSTNTYLLNLFEKGFLRLGKLGLLFNRVIKTWCQAIMFFKANKKKVLWGFLICLPIHGISFLTTYMLALSININISFFDISLITALVWLITAIPITISGAGIRELSMIYLFSLYGVNAEAATALALYKYILMIIFGLLSLLFLIDWLELGKWLFSRFERS